MRKQQQLAGAAAGGADLGAPLPGHDRGAWRCEPPVSGNPKAEVFVFSQGNGAEGQFRKASKRTFGLMIPLFTHAGHQGNHLLKTQMDTTAWSLHDP